MVTRLTLLVTLVVSVFALIPATRPAVAQPPLPPMGSMTGIVTAKDTGAPVQGITVYAREYALGGYGGLSTVTGSNGGFSFDLLPVGDYRIYFAPPIGYSLFLPQWYDNQPGLDTAKVIQITGGTTLTGVNASLLRGGTMTGVIKLADGGNPAQVSVTIYDNPFGLGKLHTAVDSSGVYTMTGLPSGRYHLIFDAPGYVQQAFNDKPDLSSADEVSVTAPFTTTGVNVTLQRGATIKGSVNDAQTGQGMYTVQVIANGPRGSYRTFPDNSGQYALTGLPTGNYRVSFLPNTTFAFYIGQTYRHTYLDPFSSDVIPVNTLGITVSADAVLLHPSGGLTVIAKDADTGWPITDFAIDLSRPCMDDYPLHPPPYGAYMPGPASAPTYTLTTFVGPWIGASSYIPQETVFRGITSTDEMALTVTLHHGGQLSGTIVNTSGTGLQGVQVNASLPATGDYRTTDTAQDGTFLIQGLPDGKYRLRAFPSVEPTGIYAQTTIPSVTISSANSVSLGNLVMATGSWITGTITAQNGTLLPQAYSVEAMDAATGVVASAFTDNSGHYILKNMPPGTYRVRLNAPMGYQSDNLYANIGNSPLPPNPYVPEYYANPPMSATTVISIPSTLITVTDINAALETGGTIAGNVADAYGIAIPGARISIYDSNNTLVEEVASHSSGSYVTNPALPPGQYKVRVSNTACNGVPYATVFYRSTSRSTSAKTTQQVVHTDGAGASLAEATPVTVVAGQTTQIPATALVTGASIVKGRVTTNGVGIAGFKLSLTNGDEATTDATGTYTFTGVYTGALIVAPSAGMGATIPVSRNVSAPDFTSQDFTVGTPPALNSIGGRVTRNGVGVAGYILKVNNDVQATTDASGSYTVEGLPAGSYTIMPAPGQAPATPISRTVSVPLDVTDANFTLGARVNLPLVEQLAAQLARR